MSTIIKRGVLLAAFALALLLLPVATDKVKTTEASGCYGGYVAYASARQFQPTIYNNWVTVNGQFVNGQWVNGQWVTPAWQTVTGQLTNGQWVHNTTLYGFWVNNFVSYCVTPGPYVTPQVNINYWPAYYQANWYTGYMQQFQYVGWYQTYYNQLMQQNPGLNFHNVSYYGFLPNGCYAGPSQLPRYNNGC